MGTRHPAAVVDRDLVDAAWFRSSDRAMTANSDSTASGVIHLNRRRKHTRLLLAVVVSENGILSLRLAVRATILYASAYNESLDTKPTLPLHAFGFDRDRIAGRWPVQLRPEVSNAYLARDRGKPLKTATLPVEGI